MTDDVTKCDRECSCWTRKNQFLKPEIEQRNTFKRKSFIIIIVLIKNPFKNLEHDLLVFSCLY